MFGHTEKAATGGASRQAPAEPEASPQAGPPAPRQAAPDVAPPASRSAIIIFGAAVLPSGQPSQTLRRRVEAAARCGAGLTQPLYLPTGAKGRHGAAEAEVMASLLRDLGVAPADILPEPTGNDTFSSALACTRLLRARSHRGAVFAASSAYHLPRCVALLRLAGWKVRACPPPPHPAAARLGKRWYWRLREAPALPYDALLMLWARLRGQV